MFNKILKRKQTNCKDKTKLNEVELKLCPMSVDNEEALLQIEPDEYILKDNETLVRVNNDIYMYKNNGFELLKEPLSEIVKKRVLANLNKEMMENVDTIRNIISECSSKSKNEINLNYYNFNTRNIFNYGVDKFQELLNSDGSEFILLKNRREISFDSNKIVEDLVVTWSL